MLRLFPALGGWASIEGAKSNKVFHAAMDSGVLHMSMMVEPVSLCTSRPSLFAYVPEESPTGFRVRHTCIRDYCRDGSKRVGMHHRPHYGRLRLALTVSIPLSHWCLQRWAIGSKAWMVSGAVQMNQAPIGM